MKNFISAFAVPFLFGAASLQADTLTPLPAQDLLVRFTSQVSETAQSQILSKQGLKVEWRSTLVPGLVRAGTLSSSPSVRVLSSAQIALNQLPEIQYAEPDHRIHRKLAPMPRPVSEPAENGVGPSDPLLNLQWALVSRFGVNPNGAWEKTTGKREIRVAILDTGIQRDHPELSDRVLPGYDFIDRDSDPSDSHGHGTHVSGIIGARWDNNRGIAGINREVTFLPIRVVPDNDDETDSNLIEAFEYAVKEGARIANCSFGKEESGQAVKDVITAAGRRGLLVVVAAGNSMQDIGQRPTFPASFQTPNMIVVGASAQSGGLAFFSNYSRNFVHVAAPGAGILSSIKDGGYAAWDGTSMASPQVAGVAALTLSADPGLSMGDLREILVTTVARRSSLEGRVATGGLIDATAAVEKALK